MIAALLLAVIPWCWEAPAADCHGGPEISGIEGYYYVATIRQNVQYACLDDQGQPMMCNRIDLLAPAPFFRVAPSALSSTSCSAFDPPSRPDLLPTPPLDGVSAWPWPWPAQNSTHYPIGSCDRANNCSFSGCPGGIRFEAVR